MPFAPIASATRAKFGFLKSTPKGTKPGFLLLDFHEVERFIVEDDVDDARLALHEGRQIAEREHRKTAVAAQPDRLASGVGQLCAEGIRHGVGHRRPGKGAEEPAIGAALDVSREPDAGRASVGEKHGVVGSQRA